MTTSFGESGLSGGPGRALVLAAAALGAGDEVEQLLPAEVLDLARRRRPSSSVIVSGSISGVVPSGPSARGRREKATLNGAITMWRCFE